METTIKRLKIGSKLRFGKYGAGGCYPEPIIWLKATPNCDFISERVLDILCFDAYEESNGALVGNNSWTLSNICQFLNSAEEEWYVPSHPNDRPPQAGKFVAFQTCDYSEHSGFLRWFEDYEQDSIQEQSYTVGDCDCYSRVRLLSKNDIFGDERLSIFKGHRGYRAHPTGQCVRRLFAVDCDRVYTPYYLMNPGRLPGYVCRMDRTGYIDSIHAVGGCGIRPTLRISPDTAVTEVEEGVYAVSPFEISPIPVGTHEDIMRLLGMAQP